MKFCPVCGNPAEDNIAFCGKCGNRFDQEINAPTFQAVPQQNMPNVMPPYVNNQGIIGNDNMPAKKKSKKKFIIIAAAVCVVAIVAVVFFFFMPKSVEKPDLSFEKGIDLSKLDGVAWQASDGSYHKVLSGYEMDKKMGEEIDFDDVSCILGRDGHFGRVSGSYSMFKQYRMSVQTTNGNIVDCVYVRNWFGDSAEKDLYGIELVFVDDFNYDGVTKSSSVSAIKKAGYKECTVDGAYFKVFSDKKTSWKSLKSDYEDIHDMDISSPMALKDGYPVEYGKELLSCRGLFNDPIGCNDKQRDFSLGSRGDKILEDFKENAMIRQKPFREQHGVGFDEYFKDIVPKEAAIAQQWYYMNKGDIDYFAVVEIETHNEKTDKSFSGGTAGLNNSLSGSNNVCHVFLFGNRETVIKWLEGWGF